MSVNKVILIGNIGQKPELKNTSNNNSMVSFSLATNERVKNQQTGNFDTKTEWHRCIAFDRTAEVMAQYLDKGSKIYIEGKLRTNKYTGQDGIEKESTQIVVTNLTMLDSRNSQISNNIQDNYMTNNPHAGIQPQSNTGFGGNQGGFGNSQGGFSKPNAGFANPNAGAFGAKPTGGFGGNQGSFKDKPAPNPRTTIEEDDLPF